MKNLLTCVRKAALPLLMGCAACAVAQSLGTPAAQVWLGRPLEMTVPARFQSSDSSDECVHADVFFGETRVPADRVRTTVSGTDQQRRVRIVTDSLVDEPIVTVSVRAGCASSITRNYTLLPELPSEAMLAQLGRMPTVAGPAVAIPLAGAPAAVRAPAGSPLRIARSTSGSTSAAPRPSSLRDVVAQARQATAIAAPAPQRMRTARAFRADTPAATGPRLRLEPLQLEEQAMLRVSASLAAPAGDAAQRATAALLWQAINADPQELLRTSAMLHKLETDLVQLRQSATVTRNEMAALRRRLDEAQPWYASATMVQVLALLVLATGAAAVFLWLRSRRAGLHDAWYAPVGAPVEPLAEVATAGPESVTSPESQPVVRRTESVPGQGRLPVPAFVAPVHAAASDDTAPAPIDFEVPLLPQEPQPRRAMVGELRVETLAATLEEVEFLSSLGLSTDALDVLKGYLHDSVSPAPLAFFELMRLCDEGEDATAIGTVRRRYVQAFGIEAPRLDQVLAPLGLENLPHLSNRIIRAWGKPEALALIEDALFNVPEPGAALTLQAGRDLVCLYDVAMAIATESAGGQSTSDAEAHPLAPWAHALDAQGALAAAQAAAEAQGGHHFALDIDLDAAPDALPDPQEQADDLRLVPLLAEMQAAAARENAARAQQDDEDAFSAAMASERAPVSRY